MTQSCHNPWPDFNNLWSGNTLDSLSDYHISIMATAPRGRLQDKNAIITGAAGWAHDQYATTTNNRESNVIIHSGIGLETTILFAREGASVLMADISEPALAKALEKVKEIVPGAIRVETVKCDVSKEADVQAMVEKQDSWGGTDVIFNNAGIMHADDADAIDTPDKIWDLTQNINVKGVWYGSKHAVLSFRRHKKTKGSIINTASVVALVGSATPQLAYTASKGAVLAMTRELAIVHAREGFRFNALCPAPLKYALLLSCWNMSETNCKPVAHLFFKTGSAMTKQSAIAAKFTSPLDASERQLSRHTLSCSLPATSRALWTVLTLWLTVEWVR
jgi:NAD(P)-dependent dehydrogenase (short-subunit alcohol dehydrogenase family)